MLSSTDANHGPRVPLSHWLLRNDVFPLETSDKTLLNEPQMQHALCGNGSGANTFEVGWLPSPGRDIAASDIRPWSNRQGMITVLLFT